MRFIFDLETCGNGVHATFTKEKGNEVLNEQTHFSNEAEALKHLVELMSRKLAKLGKPSLVIEFKKSFTKDQMAEFALGIEKLEKKILKESKKSK